MVCWGRLWSVPSGLTWWVHFTLNGMLSRLWSVLSGLTWWVQATCSKWYAGPAVIRAFRSYLMSIRVKLESLGIYNRPTGWWISDITVSCCPAGCRYGSDWGSRCCEKTVVRFCSIVNFFKIWNETGHNCQLEARIGSWHCLAWDFCLNCQFTSGFSSHQDVTLSLLDSADGNVLLWIVEWEIFGWPVWHNYPFTVICFSKLFICGQILNLVIFLFTEKPHSKMVIKTYREIWHLSDAVLMLTLCSLWFLIFSLKCVMFVCCSSVSSVIEICPTSSLNLAGPNSVWFSDWYASHACVAYLWHFIHH